MRERFTLLVTLLALFTLLASAGLRGKSLPVERPKLEKCLPGDQDFDGTFNGCSLACAMGWTYEASSSLPRRGPVAYSPDMAGDGKASTAWCEGARGDGIGEWIELRLKAGPAKDATSFSGATIADGYCKSETTWTENSRARQLRVDMNGKPRCLLDLADTRHPQRFRIASIASVRPGDRLRFTITAVYRGAKYRDTCITEIVLEGAH